MEFGPGMVRGSGMACTAPVNRLLQKEDRDDESFEFVS